MNQPDPIRAVVLSVVKHDYIARGVASHPRFELAVVADASVIKLEFVIVPRIRASALSPTWKLPLLTMS